MRESLFRGKREDNGEWVQGCHHKRRILNQETGKLEFADDIQCNTEDEDGLHSWSYLIDPETLGQFTGMYDSTKWEELTKKEQKEWIKKHPKEEWKGKPIFEGDIVEIVGDAADCIEKIIFDVQYKTHENYDPCGYELYNCIEYVVIGNIHDNPELLQEKVE